MDWHALPTTPVPLNQVVFPCHDLDPAHVHPVSDLVLSTGPIHVQALLDGSFFIHDGRHRALRAQHDGRTHIDARIHP